MGGGRKKHGQIEETWPRGGKLLGTSHVFADVDLFWLFGAVGFWISLLENLRE